MGFVGKDCELIRADIENIEMRLKCFLEKLQVESSILDKIVYKNKNQHKHCLYFHHLLKVKYLYMCVCVHLVDDFICFIIFYFLWCRLEVI